MSQYPNEYDNWPNPSSTDSQGNPSHSELHSNINSSLYAIQHTLGLNPDGNQGSVANRLEVLETSTLEINTQIDTFYTLVLTDVGKLVTLANDDPVTLTVPKNSVVAFPVGVVVNLVQTGIGQVSVVPVDGDVTLNSTGFALSKQWSAASLIKIDTDVWLLIGDVE